MNRIYKVVFLLLNVLVTSLSFGQTTTFVSKDTSGKLVYSADAKGNRLPDFSGVGYMNSEVAIPTVAVVKTVYPVAGDNLSNIQNAINEVAAMPLGKDGFRGAILFKAGLYNISDSIKISASGIVLRGEGKDTTKGTRFHAYTLTQYSLINFIGKSSTSSTGTKQTIADPYVPIGATSVTLVKNSFKVGDSIMITRTPNQAWINLIGMDLWAWTPSTCNITYLRKVTGVNGNTISFDAPMVDAIDSAYATGQVVKYKAKWSSQSGIENMSLTSAYSSDTAMNHGWEAINFDNFINGWVRNVDVYYFAYAAVHVLSGAAWITVDSSKMIDAKCNRLAGFSYHYEGTRNLTKNCWTRNGMHDYVTGSRNPGPNVFSNCTATLSQMNIGPHLKWATGCLFDNIISDGTQALDNRSDDGNGAMGQGWGGAQFALWNCTAKILLVQDIPGDERNWAIGCKYTKSITNVGKANVQESIGDTSSIGHPIVAIPSLFIAQLNDRLGTQKKKSQSISFDTLSVKHLGDTDFIPTCISNSSLQITLTSMNTSVATIVNGKIHIVGIGTAIINASQIGDTNYLAAPVFGQLLTVAAPLPIGIKNFSATIKSKSVVLNWDVADAIGINNYQIESSKDAINFISIGKVESSNIVNYNFKDITPSLPAYYRIKMLGNSGNVTYSNSLFIANKSTDGISIYPNPVTNNLTITGLNGQSNLKIVNSIGQMMRQQNTSANALNLDVSTLKEGVYILSITDDADRISIRKFIKK